MTGAVARQGWLHLVAGFIAMGGWAMIANRAHPWPEVVQAGAVQGGLSAGITLVMKRLIEALVARLAGWRAYLVPPMVCGALSIAILTTVHGLAGTPEVTATIIVPVSVATGYAALYARTLNRARRMAP